PHKPYDACPTPSQSASLSDRSLPLSSSLGFWLASDPPQIALDEFDRDEVALELKSDCWNTRSSAARFWPSPLFRLLESTHPKPSRLLRANSADARPPSSVNSRSKAVGRRVAGFCTGMSPGMTLVTMLA